MVRKSTIATVSDNERRAKRSPWASEALRFQLQHVSKNYNIDSMVLADCGGHLWAASTWDDPAQTHLASSVAGMGVLANEGQGFTIAQQRGKSVQVKRLSVGSATLYLAAQGAQRQTAAALDHAIPGVQRILNALI